MITKKNIKYIVSYGLPGFYTDAAGRYGAIIGDVYISCFVNQDENQYDVCLDAVDRSGDFALNIERRSFETANDAVNEIRRLVKWAVNNLRYR